MDSAIRFAPFLAGFLPIGDRRQRSGLLFYMSQVLLVALERKRRKRVVVREPGVAFAASMNSLFLYFVLPPPLSLSLFASASRTKIFETRARTLALAYPPPSSPFPTITSSFFFFASSNLYISSALFSFLPFRQHLALADSSIGEKPFVRRQEMHYIWQRFHSARLSLFSLGRFRQQPTYPTVTRYHALLPPTAR